MKRLIRYRKKIVSLMCAVLICSIGIFSTSFNVCASDVPTYYIPVSEPAKSENQGYMVVLWKDLSTGVMYPYVYFWNTIGTFNTGYEAHTYAYITLGYNSIDFAVGGSSGVASYYSLAQVDGGGYYTWLKHSSTDHWIAQYNGWEIVGVQYAGNVGYINKSNYPVSFICYFDENGASVLLNDILYTLAHTHNVDVDILNKINSIFSSVDGLENQLSSIINYLKSIDSELDSIKSELQEIYDKADEILNEEKEQTTWLGKIWQSIQEFITPKNDDKQKTDDFNSESESQKNEIDDLNAQNRTNQIDVDSASSQVDANINYDNMAQYGGVLATITNNNYVLQMILIVVSVAIIAYVLFGKR